jgi:hypothetical protein
MPEDALNSRPLKPSKRLKTSRLQTGLKPLNPLRTAILQEGSRIPVLKAPRLKTQNFKTLQDVATLQRLNPKASRFKYLRPPRPAGHQDISRPLKASKRLKIPRASRHSSSKIPQDASRFQEDLIR